MAAYTDSLGFNKGTPALFDRNERNVVLMEVELNFAKIAAARAAAGAAALAATDTLEVMPLPPSTLVLAAGVRVSKVEGATATIDLGDSGNATRYVSNADLNALTNVAGTTAFYNATGLPLRVTLDHNSIDAAVATVWALVAGRVR
jgi:hypothetical protein